MINPRLRFITLSVLGFMAIVTWVYAAGAEEAKESNETKAALVNGKIISTEDFQREYELYQNHFRSRSPNLTEDFLKRLRVQVVNEMINQELLYQASQKQEIVVGSEDVNKEIGAFQKKFPNETQYREWLNKMQFTEEAFKAQFAKRMTVRALVEKEIVSKINIKDKEAKAYFEKNPEKFKVDEVVRARHILIKLDKSADDKAKTAARKKLTDIKKLILSGEDFAELAKAHSQGPSGPRGGDLGYFKRGQMVKPFDEVAFKLAANEVSDIVETQFGYHLIKVVDHKLPESPKYDEAKDKTIKMMRNERIQKQVSDYIGKLREKATIETFIN